MKRVKFTNKQLQKLQNYLDKVTGYHDVIHNNKSMFIPGAVITAETFCNWFGIPVNSDIATPQAQMKVYATKLKHKTELNLLLAKRGLYIKMKDYGAEFRVLPKEETELQVIKYEYRATNNKEQAAVLDTGLAKHKGKWSSLRSREQEEVADRLCRRTIRTNRVTYK